MNVLNRERISELMKHRAPLSVSIFMPTHRAGREQQQDTIRLKNLANQAREKLLEQAASPSAAEKVLQPIHDLRLDELFWRYRSDGLACFCSPNTFKAYRVPLKLDQRLFINERFHTRPLLPLLRSDARVYILMLTQENARLYEATMLSMREIELEGIVKPDVDGDEQSLQYHSHKAPTQGKGETEAAIYHGHGGPADRAKKDTQKFFQLVDRAVNRVLRGQTSPLLLACVGYLASIYESVNSYRNLLRGKIPGSPERWSEEELREHAWKLVEPEIQGNEKVWRQFREASGNGRGSDELRSVVLAAEQGRVDRLLVASNEERWGHLDPKLGALHTTDSAQQGEELLDYAVMRTLSNGGEVYLLESLPTDAPVAATFRY